MSIIRYTYPVRVASCTESNVDSYLTPRAHVAETADGYVLEAELPGVPREGLQLTVENGELTLLGKRPEAKVPGRPAGDYRRTFELDPSIDSTKITAKLENGVLHLTLPKAEAAKPRQIPLQP